MVDANSKKLLVSMDGSERALRTAEYLAQMPAFYNMQVNLFNVFAGVPESYFDLGREPACVNITAGMYSWEKQQRGQIEQHLQKCRSILLSADYNPNKVQTTIKKRRVGIARDIIAESNKGYTAVVLRRRGMGRLQGLVMGSVALKLLNGIDSVPIIFAGRKTNRRRVLVAVDGSDNAMRAVDLVADMLGGFDYAIGLVTVVRAEAPVEQAPGTDSTFKSYLDDIEIEVRRALDKAQERLLAAGFDDSNLSLEFIRGAQSRAAAIVDVADKGGFDTIVLGRRGMSRVQQFSAGRVSTKVLQIGQKYNVWIVN
jgi:nucleotide-binding universal stress UspA family protein